VTAITEVPGGPFAAGATLVYTGRLLDGNGNGIPASALDSLTLTLATTATGAVVNGVDHVNILNTGRGTVDDEGNLTITLGPADTVMDPAPAATVVKRSIVMDWTFNGGADEGRHEARLTFVALTEANP